MATVHQANGRLGALRSWSNTVDRSERTAPARRVSPSSIQYHYDRLNPERFADATEAQKLAAAEAGSRAYYAELAMRSARARRRGGDAA